MATTLLQFRNRIRDRADLVADNFVLDATLNQWVNDSVSELYDLLIQSSEDWYITSATAVIAGAAVSFATPAGMIRFHGLDRDLGGGRIEHIKRGNFRERSTYSERRYCLTQGTVLIFPISSAVGNYIQWYTPVFTPLVADGDSFDGVNGWEEYVVVDVALKCRVKGEEDTGDLAGSKEALRRRIQTTAATRDVSEAPRITDVHADDFGESDF